MSDYQKKQLERQRKLAELQKKKKMEEEMLNKANKLLESAKILADKHKFLEAAPLYQEAADEFKKLGWEQQAEALNNEVLMMEKKQDEYKKKLSLEEEAKRKQEEAYEKRATDIINQKVENQKRMDDLKNRPPPEILRKIEEANFLIKKAELKINQGKYKNARQRLEAVLAIYNELNYDDQKKQEIQNRLDNLPL